VVGALPPRLPLSTVSQTPLASVPAGSGGFTTLPLPLRIGLEHSAGMDSRGSESATIHKPSARQRRHIARQKKPDCRASANKCLALRLRRSLRRNQCHRCASGSMIGAAIFLSFPTAVRSPPRANSPMPPSPAVWIVSPQPTPRTES